MGVVTQLADSIDRLTVKQKLSPVQVAKLQALSSAAAALLRRFQQEEDARAAPPRPIE